MAPKRSLRAALASPHGRSRYVRQLFDTIADRYDLITVLLSFGQDARWKRRLVALSGVTPGSSTLDLACGTGDLAFEVARQGGRVVGLDITPRMVALARQKRAAHGAPAFLVGDMMALPFPAASFDLVTTGYGVRNVPEIEGALREIFRVLRPGGRILSLDFNRPEQWLTRSIYLTYLTVVGSALGFALHRDPDTYRYIPESIRRYPGAAGIAAMMQDLGFAQARWTPLLGGLMAINSGLRPHD